MQTPEASAAPAPEKEKPSRRRRGCLIMFIIAALLMPGFYWFENWSGRRALEKVVAEYEAAGLSLDPATFLQGAVPAEENFGSTPLLDGIMHPDDGSAAGNAAKAKRQVLIELLPRRGKAGSSKVPAYEVPAEMPDVTGDKPEWDKVRGWLAAWTVCQPPAAEPSDARAVFLALEVHRAVFDELATAARRPQAFFTPSPQERAARSLDPADSQFLISETLGIMRLLTLRAHAAAACGEFESILTVQRVLWKLRAASLTGQTLIGHLIARTYESAWNTVAKAMLRAPGVTEGQLAQLAATCLGGWSPESELGNTFRGESAFVYASFVQLREKAVEPEAWGLSGFRARMLRFGPSGWVEQNIVTLLERRLQYIHRPLLLGGLKALPEAGEALDAVGQSYLEDWSPNRFLQLSAGEGAQIRFILFRNLRTRLTLLAIAMERYRLKHGRYPADTAALVPDCIAAIPPDMDGAPLRLVTSPDGAGAVLYSIGWNLTDDWHGAIPKSYKEDDDYKNDDWPLVLPFPPLPPP